MDRASWLRWCSGTDKIVLSKTGMLRAAKLFTLGVVITFNTYALEKETGKGYGVGMNE